jgi:hypothetical protein
VISLGATCPAYSTLASSRTAERRHVRFGVEIIDPATLPCVVDTVIVSHPTLTPVLPGATDVALLRVQVTTFGFLDTLYINSMVFNDKGMPGATSAKLYYTGSNSTFSTATPLGTLSSTTNSL